MKEGAVDRERAVVAHDQAPEVTEPGVGVFNNPSPPVTPQRSVDCAPWVHKTSTMPREEFKREVDRYLSGKETEP
jgi:hypothetical protein